jgi:squalene-hopene/tetraprenyl-beta-curcumene cyclase
MAVALATAVTALPAAEPAKPTAAEWKAVVDKAVGYLKAAQAADGSWSAAPNNRGVTGIVVTGLLRTGTAPTDEPAAKGLAFIESLVNPKEGHIAGDSKIGIANYVTSINVQALAAAGRDEKYRPIVKNAADYLRKIQWDEGEKTGPDDVRFGGSGYGGNGGTRPDLSNTSFFLDALKAAGTPPDDPAFRKAVVFIGRCQNLKGEHNDQPWAGKINDGSFIYTPVNGGEVRTDRKDPAGQPDLAGYGSMTYAGIKSMIYCGLSKDDPRVKAAVGWIRKNYTLDANPGMPPQIARRGLYYYYNTFAKAMDALGEDEFVDDKGVKHDWRADLFEAIRKRQGPDGGWKNTVESWMESDPNLVTGYALMALSYCKPK